MQHAQACRNLLPHFCHACSCSAGPIELRCCGCALPESCLNLAPTAAVLHCSTHLVRRPADEPQVRHSLRGRIRHCYCRGLDHDALRERAAAGGGRRGAGNQGHLHKTRADGRAAGSVSGVPPGVAAAPPRSCARCPTGCIVPQRRAERAGWSEAAQLRGACLLAHSPAHRAERLHAAQLRPAQSRCRHQWPRRGDRLHVVLRRATSTTSGARRRVGKLVGKVATQTTARSLALWVMQGPGDGGLAFLAA